MLEVKEIHVYYGKVEAIKGLSVWVAPGEIVTLIGPNGAGKTTVLKAISGLKNPSSGEIWFDGQRIDRLPPHEIVRLGVAHVPEGRRLFPYMSVVENLMLGAYTCRSSREKEQRLELVFRHFPVLKERRAQQAGSLSGGEQQMLAIGRALMAGPRLLLMDEPSLGLSPIMAQEIGNIISEINKEGVSILLVEQNARLALKLAHRGYVLETGTIMLQGKADQLSTDHHVKQTYLGG